jgi:curved DNA-binding protein CbpA
MQWQGQSGGEIDMQKQYEMYWCDYYYVLGVRINADPEVVKSAYKALARKSHSDVTANATDQRMKVLNEAWEILSNEQSKAEYDKAWMERYNKRFNAKTEEKQASKATGKAGGQSRQSPKSEGEASKTRNTADSENTARTKRSKGPRTPAPAKVPTLIKARRPGLSLIPNMKTQIINW